MIFIKSLLPLIADEDLKSLIGLIQGVESEMRFDLKFQK